MRPRQRWVVASVTGRTEICEGRSSMMRAASARDIGAWTEVAMQRGAAAARESSRAQARAQAREDRATGGRGGLEVCPEDGGDGDGDAGDHAGD